MQIILYSVDILLLTYWEKVLNNKCHTVNEIEALNDVKDSIIILNYSKFNSEIKNILMKSSERKNNILILDRNPTLNTAKSILNLGAKGYGNALMREHFLISAVETLKEELVWLHPEFTTMLINEIPKSPEKKVEILLKDLSQREKEVALLLKDGDRYNDIAIELNIKPRTVKAHAQNIYSKLNLKDKIGLALLLK